MPPKEQYQNTSNNYIVDFEAMQNILSIPKHTLGNVTVNGTVTAKSATFTNYH